MRLKKLHSAFGVPIVLIGFAAPSIAIAADALPSVERAQLTRASSPVRHVVRPRVQQEEGLRLMRSLASDRLVIRAPRPAESEPVEVAVPKPSLPFDPSLALRRVFSLESLLLEQPAALQPAELLEVVQAWLGRSLTLAEFHMAAFEVIRHLREHGHPNAAVQISQRDFERQGAGAIVVSSLTPPVLDAEPRIMVASFRVEGLSTISDDQIAARLAAWSNRALTLDELAQAAEDVALVLRGRGFGLAQAFIPPQDVADDVVTIQVVEGRVDASAGDNGLTVTMEGPGRIEESVVSAFIAHGVEGDTPLNVEALERALRIASDLPGVKSVTADLAPGNEPGTTQVVAAVETDPVATYSASMDNYGSVYTGRERATLRFNLDSPRGLGERYYGALTASERSAAFSFGTDWPIGSAGWRAGGNLAGSRASIDIKAGGDRSFELSPDLNSGSFVAGLFANYPIVRGPSHTVLFSSALDVKRYNRQSSRLEGLDSDHDVTSLSLSMSGEHLDAFRGQTNWNVNLAHGRVDLSRNRNNEEFDALTLRTAGAFSTLRYSLSRLQALPGLPGQGWTLLAGVTGQLASKNLDPVEKFQLGGPGGVRSYPSGEGSGDEGWLVNLELAKFLGAYRDARFSSFAFYDTGRVTEYKKPYFPTLLPNSYALSSHGLGIRATYREQAQFGLTVAQRLGSNPRGLDADGRSSKTRYWAFGSVDF